MTASSSPVFSRRWLKRITIALVAIFVVSLLGYAYASPYIALNRIKRAADARDAATLNEYVDYPALRTSLKAEVGEMLEKRIGAQHSSNPLLLFGAAIGAALIGPLVDAYATPNGVAALLNGMPPRGEPGERPPATVAGEPAQQAPSAPAQPAPPASAPMPATPASAAVPPARPQSTARYRGINEFVVTWRHSADEPRYAAVLQRHGLFTWKLAAVELNDDN